MYNLPCGTCIKDYPRDMGIIRTKGHLLLSVLGCIAFIIFPHLVSSHIHTIANIIGVWIVAACGLNLLIGLCGQISIGHAAFMGVGAYTSALLGNHLSFPFWLSWPAGMLAAGLVGVIFGLPAVRVKGFYLALTTLAAQIILGWIYTNWRDMTGGSEGIGVPTAQFGGFSFDSEISWYYVIGISAILATISFKNFSRSRLGRALVAIRDNDLAAEGMGVNLFRYKALAFFIGCLYAGAAGGLWAHYTTHIAPAHFELKESIWFLGMLIVGGLGSTLGPVFGVPFILILKEVVVWLGPVLMLYMPFLGMGIWASFSLIVFAVVLIIFLIFEPRGIAHRWEIFKNYYRTWPFAY